MLDSLRAVTRTLVLAAVAFLPVVVSVSPAAALICGDTILDPGEDCEAPFGGCCGLLTCKFLTAGTVCRTGSGDTCDPSETCSGSSAACPADTVATLGTTCRAGSGDLCDPAESCLGIPLLPCPVDVLLPGGTPCRLGSLDSCDPNENCTGVAGQACPADVVTPAGTVCRTGSGDTCDPDETCTGTPGAMCPADTITSAGTVCRAATGVCDIAEVCSGAASAPCPADSVQPPATPCDDSLFCTTGDACSGAGSCVGTARDCSDSDVCTTDTCDEGSDSCSNVADGASCDDGNPCTTDTCDSGLGCTNSATPRNTCYDPGVAKLSIRDRAIDDEKDYLRWGWRRGHDFAPSAIGSPLSTTWYALCVYDYDASVPSLAASYVAMPDASLWQFRGSRASYSNRTGNGEGVKQIRLKAGALGKTKAAFRASGLSFNPPPPASASLEFTSDPSVIVQLLNSDDECWTSTFEPDTTKKNLAGSYKSVGH